MTVKITLTKPIEAHGQKVSELELREPNGGDIAECGLPFEMAVGTNGQSTGKVDGAAVLRYISVLANIPPSSAKMLAPRDFMTALGEVLGFFGESSPETP
ncbi:MAG: phage tail assembly protein [Rhizomicrobium sp.]